MKQTSKQTPEDRFKFRVYSQRLKRYIEQSPCIGLTGKVMDIHTLEKNHIIEQCTGLKDRNGKLIFEGDIVRDTNNLQEYTVIWHYGFSQFVYFKVTGELSYITLPLCRCEQKFIEIIGNVHDNEEGNKDV